MQYYIQKTLPLPFEKALSRVKEALGAEGFGVLTEIDVKETMNISEFSASGSGRPGGKGSPS